jgi:cephalosporin hydroxylase
MTRPEETHDVEWAADSRLLNGEDAGAPKAPIMPKAAPFPERDPSEAQEIVRRFHDLYCQSGERTWKDTRWLGVPVIKCPLDLWIYQELVHHTRPDLIVETGTARGGSAYFLACICDMIGTGRIVTIDSGTLPEGTVPGRPAHPRITYVTGDSVAPEIVARVRDSIGPGETVTVILDSFHGRDHVLEEMEAYGPLVSEGHYLIVEDTNINSWRRHTKPGPLEAVHEFLAGNDQFVVDRSWEKFFMTWNPSGFLRRIR